MLSASRRVPAQTHTPALLEKHGQEKLSNPEAASDAESGLIAWDNKVAAFLQVAELRRPQMMRLAKRFVDDRDEAEDIVQEAILSAFRYLPHFRGDSQMATWLGAIVLNAGREWVRKRKGQAFLPLEYVVRQGDDPIVYDLPDSRPNPEQNCEQKEMAYILLSEIDEMTSASKSAIRMCALEGFSHLEAANALGVNVSTIKSRIFEGKQTLKRRMCLCAGPRSDLMQSMEIVHASRAG